jgi:pyridoxamine 5'-phosphate oxidase
MTDDVFDHPPAEPLGELQRWLAAAVAAGVREPGALALATVAADGRCSSRIVQTIRLTAAGLVFTSHAGSPKGRDIAATGWASGVLYWRETGQQVVLAGPVRRRPDAEADALWAARPATTHPMSVASAQSEPLADEAALRAAARALADGRTLPRPDAWAAYELAPSTVEFWQADPDRLHRRLRYDLTAGGWTSHRLQP